MVDPKSYMLGKKSTQSFKTAARRVLGEGEAAERLGEAAPYLCGHPEAVGGFELYAIVEWLARPVGPPPSASFEAYRGMISECRFVIDDREIEEQAKRAEDLPPGFGL